MIFKSSFGLFFRHIFCISFNISKDSEIDLFVLDIVSTRSELMKLEEKAEAFSHDRYVFIRDVYLDRREFLVYDGEIYVDDDLYKDLEDE